jgi:hypothetical protein
MVISRPKIRDCTKPIRWNNYPMARGNVMYEFSEIGCSFNGNKNQLIFMAQKYSPI